MPAESLTFIPYVKILKIKRLNTTLQKKVILMNKTEESMLPSLLKFFSVREHFDVLKEFKLSKQSKLSVGLLNWFNVNYSKEYGVEYNIESLGRKRNVYVWQSYNAALSGYKKEYFDPFARGKNCGKEIAIEFEGETLCTTIRQLNYFRWAINNGVIDYVRRHVDEIYNDMTTRGRHGTKETEIKNTNQDDANEKKRQISVSASKKLGIHDVTMTVKFGGLKL
jgi:hypothetical protein